MHYIYICHVSDTGRPFVIVTFLTNLIPTIGQKVKAIKLNPINMLIIEKLLFSSLCCPALKLIAFLIHLFFCMLLVANPSTRAV